MKTTKSILSTLIFTSIVFSHYTYANSESPLSSFDDEMPMSSEKIDPKQDLHWSWCGKKCREEAKIKAKKVLKRLDNLVNKYENQESFYEDASDIFKKKATMNQWLSAFNSREILGNKSRRIHESTQGTFRNLPNVDRNKRYVIVTFDTVFENTKGIYSEQVTLARKKNNKYKFVGYFFTKKPYYEYKSPDEPKKK